MMTRQTRRRRHVRRGFNLVELLMALAEDRDPWPNARQSANWTCVGILAHESAMAGGERKSLPEWTFSG